jgi:hypothetical protein
MIGALFAILILLIVSYLVRPDYSKAPQTRVIYNWGVFFRIVGTLSYLYYAYYLTSGNVDAFIYDNWASLFAEYFIKGDFSPFTDPTLYRGGQLFYTNFVAYPAAFFLIITLGSTFGIYLLFSTACFVGLVLILKSFYTNYPQLDQYRITLYVLLFPAVWFWTSTIGKDSFVFLGIGFICFAFSPGRVNYLYWALGLAIVYAFRPPVAYMVLLAIASLMIFNLKDSFFLKIIKASAGILVVIYLLGFLGEKWQIESFDAETISELQQITLKNNNYGTGALEEKRGGITAVPRGVLDVLARPFIWESRDLTSLLASFEISFMLFIIFKQRQSVALFLNDSLRNPLSIFIVSFLVIYIVSTGLFENNIGLIARHRSIIFPFLFLIAFSYTYNGKRVYKPISKKRHAIGKANGITNSKL